MKVSARTTISSTGLILISVLVASAHAQSGARNSYGPPPAAPRVNFPPTNSTARDDSLTKPVARTAALGGYCPVCVIEMKSWMKGSPNYAAEFDGKTYYFPGDKQRTMFLANPDKYAPVLGGDCTVCLADAGKRMPGNIQHASIYQDRLFLFPNAAMKKKFRTDLTRYANVDIAANGNCVVCKVKMNQDVRGKPEFAATYQGMRYLFPGEKQREMFLANPRQFVTNFGNSSSLRSSLNLQNRSLDSTELPVKLVRAIGSSGCAACDHGVKPIGSPQELGLAISNGVDVFVVEDAHRLYPNIYKSRFDGLKLAVKGTVIQERGNVHWIQPTDLRVSH